MDGMDSFEKPPPIGLRPRWLVAEIRLREIDAAICRYEDADTAPPADWLEERDELLGYLSRREWVPTSAL